MIPILPFTFRNMMKHNTLWKIVAGLLVMGLWLTVAVGNAMAHAVPVITSPLANELLDQAPERLSIRFSEPVVPGLSQIRLLTQLGQEVETSAPKATDAEKRTLEVTLPPLNDGSYLVSWQALSAVDGHTTSGTFSFGVGVSSLSVTASATPTITVSPLRAAARWLTLTGIALFLAGITFHLFVWRPLLAGVELEAQEQAVDGRLTAQIIRVANIGCAILALGLVFIFIDQLQEYNLFSGSNLATWLGTRFGQMALARLLLLVVSTLFLNGFLVKGTAKGALGWWLGLVLGIGLALTNSLVSHSAALPEQTNVAIVIDLAHVLAAAIWVGGLVILGLALRLVRPLPADSCTWFTLSLMLNFSTVAAMSVGVLLLSGGYLSWQHVGSWTAFVGTAYGLTLLAKIGLMMPVLGIAFVNLLVVKPRLHRAYDTPSAPAAEGIMARFRTLVSAEMVTAMLILAVAGLLAESQRGAESPLLADKPGAMSLSLPADDLNITLSLTPALVGQNEFDVYLTANGSPVSDASEVALRYTFLGESVGASSATAVSQGNGHYLVQSSDISLIGNWQVEVSVRRPNTFDTFAPFRLTAGLGGGIQPMSGGGTLLERFARFMILFGGAATGTALIIFALSWGFFSVKAARHSWQLLLLLLISLFTFATGASQVMTFFGREYTPTKFLTNPILPDKTSIAIGEQLYSNNCLVCHGEHGYGDGPAAVNLNPPPADFTGGHTASHPDGDLYYWILNGIKDTNMPAFGDKLSEEDAWNLTNYVRRLTTMSKAVSGGPPMPTDTPVEMSTPSPTP